MDTELTAIPRTVIVIGPGLGYLVRAILAKRRDCRVIAMFLSSECHRESLERGPCAWHPGSDVDPAQFLDSELEEIESASLTVVEWPPTATCFVTQADRVRRAVADVVHRHHASLLTEGANGRRWLSNLLRNFVALDQPVSPNRGSEPGIAACVIAASGPTLEEGLPLIAASRSRISLWVVGSALDAVTAHGLQPDLVVSTDAAVYASEYVRRAVTNPRRAYPMATPLTASRGIADASPVWCLQQDDAFERTLYGEAKTSPTLVPAHGTVTGTALQLALSAQPWPVIVVGMDFAWNDLRSHARPHVGEVYRDVAGSRLAPTFTDSYRRSRGMSAVAGSWLTNPTLRIYSRWFEQAAADLDGRVRRLLPSPTSDSVPVVGSAGLEGLPGLYRRIEFSPMQWPDRHQRLLIAEKTRRKCVTALTPLAHGGGCREPDSFQAALLRRLALDAFIRWHRNGEVAELSRAASQAQDTLNAVGGAPA